MGIFATRSQAKLESIAVAKEATAVPGTRNGGRVFEVVEDRGVEPLTSTMPL